ncbi:MAG: alkaline phosphatase family protein [Candidatus Lustribacter sp.]
MNPLRIACATLALAVLPLGARSATVTYAPPAGDLPAGRYHGLTYDAVLPSGRLVTPAGTSIVTGMDSLGVVLSPDGRYAITSNDDENEAGVRSALDPDAGGGYSLTVVDTARMVAVTHYRAAGETFYSGLAAVNDPRDPGQTLVFAAGGAANAVYAFDLDAAGRLVPDAVHKIAIPGPADAGFADRGISFPSALLASSDGRRVYVVDAGGDSVAAIDTATRRLIAAPHRVGFSPAGVAVAGSQLLVTNEGLMRYALLPAPLADPAFDRPPPDPVNASSLWLLSLDATGAPAGAADALPMDEAPDGVRLVGGAHPTAIVTTPDAGYAFVAMTNVDRIATVALGAVPHVVGGTELRLFDRGPYGTQPTAMALSRDASRLYVALTGLDAIAVIDARDPMHLHRLGLIPTGWAPSAVALSADDRTLFVANQNGLGYDAGFTGNPETGADAHAVWSTLERIDLAQVKLADTTRAALAAARIVVPTPQPLPRAIRNVVLIVEGEKNYDEALGDLGAGPGAPSFALYGAADTPNLHALARRYAVAGNFFADARGGAQLVLAEGLASAFTDRTMDVNDSRHLTDQDPDDMLRLGTVFNQLARRNLSFRDYGGLLDISGTTPAGHTEDVPAPPVLAGHVDLSYPAWNSGAPDGARAAEFVRDYGTLSRAQRAPRFAFVQLRAGPDRNGGKVTPEAEVVDGDRALGTIVEAITHMPSWHTTAIIVVPAGARSGRDHIDASRTFALVVSPFAKHGYIGMRHLSTASVLKTVDRVFSLPPLSLGDLLAGDMGDFFEARSDLRPYVAALPPAPLSSR